MKAPNIPTEQGRALWRLRCDRQRRLRQRRDHERHGRVRRTVDPLLARTHGTAALSRSARADDHGPPAPTRKASRSAEPYRKLSPHVVACRTKLIFSTASTLAPVVASRHISSRSSPFVDGKDDGTRDMKIANELQAKSAPVGINKVSNVTGLYLKLARRARAAIFFLFRLGDRWREIGLGGS